MTSDSTSVHLLSEYPVQEPSGWPIGGSGADPLHLVRSRAGAPAHLPGMETIIPLSGLEPFLNNDLELWSAYEHAHQKAQIRGQFPSPDTDFHDAVAPSMVAEDISVELMAVAQKVQALTGQEPPLVDLSTDPGFAAVRVVAPGCDMRSERVHSRPRIGG